MNKSSKCPRLLVALPALVVLLLAGRNASAVEAGMALSGSSELDASSFAPRVTFNSERDPGVLAVADLDGDGKPEMMTVNYQSNILSIFRNTSNEGDLSPDSFASRVDFPAGPSPASLAVGDLDGDGKLDVVVANDYGANISVYRNTSTLGNISFAPLVNFAAGTHPVSVGIADFDGDGKSDIAVVNAVLGPSTVGIFRNLTATGSADLSFANMVEFPTGGYSFNLAVGDLDGDGKPDVAVANEYTTDVSLLRNASESGSIAFKPRVDLAVTGRAFFVSLGDLDGDGKPEVAVAHDGGVSVFRNLTNARTWTAGSFPSAVELPTGGTAYDVEMGDLDGDGKLDLAVTILYTPGVSVFQNRASPSRLDSASFGPKLDFTGEAGNVVIGDLDGDGHADLITTQNPYLSVYRNTLADMIAPRIIRQPQSQAGFVGASVTLTVVAAGSSPLSYQWQLNETDLPGAIRSSLTLNGLEFSDAGNYRVVISNEFGSETSVPAALSVDVPPPIPRIISFSPSSAAAGASVTLTGLNFSSTPSDNVVYFGAVQALVTAATPNLLTVTVPNGATYVPISVTVDGATGYAIRPFVLTFPGPGPLDASALADRLDLGAGDGPVQAAIGDLDGDGRPDVVVVNNYDSTMTIYQNVFSPWGAASWFASRVDRSTGPAPYRVVLSDIDGDGKLDIIVCNSGNHTVSVYRNITAPNEITADSFGERVDFATGHFPLGLAVADLDGDGRPDIATANYEGNSVAVLRNLSSPGSIAAASFAPSVEFSTGPGAHGVVIGDLDGDGKPDLAVANYGNLTVSVLRNTTAPGAMTASSFAPQVAFPGGGVDLAAGDLDSDGKLDLAVANWPGQVVSLLHNTSTPGDITPGSFADHVDLSLAGNAHTVAISDLNGDGKPDLAVVTEMSSTLALFENRSTPGSLSVSSFGTRADFSTGWNAVGVAAGDLNDDGKPDLVFCNAYDDAITIYRNTVGSSAGDPPIIEAQPRSQLASVGFPVILSVTAQGSAPMTYQWSFNGTPMEGAIEVSLILPSVQPGQAGTYTVRISNPFGSVESDGAILSVNTGQGGGIVSFANFSTSLVFDTDGVTRLPVGSNHWVQLYAGLSADTLQPIGAPAHIGPVPGRFFGGSRTIPTVAPLETATIQIRAWESVSGSTYEQAVANGGKTGVSPLLEVVTGGGGFPPRIPASLTGLQSFSLGLGNPLSPPQITTQPASVSTLPGASATFSVTASGPGPLHYQWTFDGTDLPGATGPVLALENIRGADAGEYRVIVSGSGGSVVSGTATLTVNVDRTLSIVSPPNRSAGELVEVPIQLASLGDVGGMSFILRYNPDYLSAPEVTWDPALDGALRQVNVSSLGRIRVVFALPATTIPAGTQTLATVNFRARTLLIDTTTALDLELVDAAFPTGDPILTGTDLNPGRATLLAGEASPGDNNGNHHVDIGDVTLLLRLLAQLDSVRSWDIARNDLNQNGQLDSGDVIKMLRAISAIDAPPPPPPIISWAGVAAATAPGAAFSGPLALLTPARFTGAAGQLVTVQVRLQGLLRPISGVTFTLHYPVAALRLPGAQSHRTGPVVPGDAVAVWNVAPAQNNYATQDGRVTLVVSTATPWPADGVVAELTFAVQPGATAQHFWPLTLTGVEVTGNGFDNRPVLSQPSGFIGRQPLPGVLSKLQRALSGECRVTLFGDAGATYRIEVSQDLIYWTRLTDIMNSTGSMSLVDADAAHFPRRFYRAGPVE